jgi:hypothetical protein
MYVRIRNKAITSKSITAMTRMTQDVELISSLDAAGATERKDDCVMGGRESVDVSSVGIDVFLGFGSKSRSADSLSVDIPYHKKKN